MTAAGGAEQRVGAPAASAYLLLIVPPLCWAGNFVVGRAIHTEIPPAALTFWRWAVAAAVLLPLAGVEAWRAREAIRRQWPLLTMLALTGVIGFQFVVYQGLHSTTAINGVLIIATIPAVIPAIAFVLDGERITRRQGLGILLSSLGVAIIVLRGDLAAALALDVAAGDLWIAAAVPMWALYSVLVRRKDAALPPLALLLAIVGIGLAVLAPGYAFELAVVGGFAPTLSTLAAIAYVGIAASVLAFWCWNRGIAGVGASKAGLYLHLMPVFAALLAVTFLGERLYAYHGVGMALVAGGLFLSSTAGGRSR
jgi:drug/metabolite transporter (DMT)-like permease